MRYSVKWPEYARQWDAMKIKSGRKDEFRKIAEYAVANRGVYAKIAAATGVPWELIAVLHKRESDVQDKHGNPLFTSYLGNGQPLSRKTTIVPKGRGPFTGPSAFFDGALDALYIDGLDAVKDWRVEKELYYCELFNGAGYANKGLPSPYVWGGTNIQKPGKYVADGKWNGSVMDGQPGCAPILHAIAELDPTVQFTRES